MQRKIVNMMLAIVTVIMSLSVIPSVEVEARGIQPWQTEYDYDLENLAPIDSPLTRIHDDRRDANGTGWFWNGNQRLWFYYFQHHRHQGWLNLNGTWFFLNPNSSRPGHNPNLPLGAMFAGRRTAPWSNTNATLHCMEFDSQGRWVRSLWQGFC